MFSALRNRVVPAKLNEEDDTLAFGFAHQLMTNIANAGGVQQALLGVCYLHPQQAQVSLRRAHWHRILPAARHASATVRHMPITGADALESSEDKLLDIVPRIIGAVKG